MARCTCCCEIETFNCIDCLNQSNGVFLPGTPSYATVKIHIDGTHRAGCCPEDDFDLSLTLDDCSGIGGYAWCGPNPWSGCPQAFVELTQCVCDSGNGQPPCGEGKLNCGFLDVECVCCNNGCDGTSTSYCSAVSKTACDSSDLTPICFTIDAATRKTNKLTLPMIVDGSIGCDSMGCCATGTAEIQILNLGQCCIPISSP